MRLDSLLLGLAIGWAASPATAAERGVCLSPEERQAVIAAHRTVPLARAIRVAKAKAPGEVVKVRLCRQDKALVYVLTVLPRSGKVLTARVDAANGDWLGGS